MRPVILYRNCNNLKDDEREHEAILQAGFTLLKSRMEIRKNDLVICRYSALPFYKELADDINYVGAKLINTHRQHMYIADLRNWVMDLAELTPETWDRLECLPDDGTSFVLKGATNSKKFQWNTHMFAKNKREACDVHSRLCADSLIGYQEIFIRKYMPLKTYMVGLQGLPITKEFRFFVCKGRIISEGFYWSSHVEDLESPPDPNEVPRSFLQEVIDRIGDSACFYTIDVAQTEDDKWIVIELNDGQQAGLSENDPTVLYSTLMKICASE